MVNWAVKYFTYDKANQLIMRKHAPGRAKQQVNEYTDSATAL